MVGSGRGSYDRGTAVSEGTSWRRGGHEDWGSPASYRRGSSPRRSYGWSSWSYSSRSSARNNDSTADHTTTPAPFPTPSSDQAAPNLLLPTVVDQSWQPASSHGRGVDQELSWRRRSSRGTGYWSNRGRAGTPGNNNNNYEEDGSCGGARWGGPGRGSGGDGSSYSRGASKSSSWRASSKRTGDKSRGAGAAKSDKVVEEDPEAAKKRGIFFSHTHRSNTYDC